MAHLSPTVNRGPKGYIVKMEQVRTVLKALRGSSVV